MTTPAPFGRLLVIGAGLLGTSVAMAVRRRWPDVRLTAMDVTPLVHPPFDVHLSAGDAVPDFDLALLSVPVSAYPVWMARLASEAPGRPVTDVGSVKRLPHEAARAAGLAPWFAGGHPMAGGSRLGPERASPALFDGRVWFVSPAGAHPTAAAQARALAEGCGATAVEVAPIEHDALVAAISHLPQVVACALMTTVADHADDDGLAAAAGGLYDSTRVAESAASMWQPILTANADQVAPLVREAAGRLMAIADGLTDADTVRAFMAAANAGRRRLPRL